MSEIVLPPEGRAPRMRRWMRLLFVCPTPMEQFQMPSNRQRPGERQPAVDWFTSHKWPDLLPTPWLTDEEFEDFVEELLKAQPLLGSQVRHVADVARWGVPGDKQDGIDFFGHFNDRTPAAWQCKQLERLRPFEVQEAVEAVTFDGAEELYLVYGRWRSMPHVTRSANTPAGSSWTDAT